MGSIVGDKPHVVCIPFPAQGHVNPFMQLAKLLHSKGFYITFVNTEFNQNRLIRSKGSDAVKDMPRFRFETIPDGVPPSDPNATQSVTELLYYTKKHSVVPLRDLILRLNSTTSHEKGVPPVSCIISDGIMCFAIKVARELGLPVTQFWTASTCGFLAYLQFVELVKRDIFPLKDEKNISNGYLNTPLEWIPGMKQMRMKDMPNFVRSTDKDDIAFNRWLEEAQDNLKADGILFNTFYEFEHQVLDEISSFYPNIYCVGPLFTLCKTLPQDEEVTTRGSSLWKENTECLTWLDKQNPNSVIYVNFGSIAVMTAQDLKEFAWGLANSGHPFLWILRGDVVMGKSAILPDGFIENTKDRGLIVSWCPQDKVLAHASVGAFLTHSGWNSTVEGICGGVPMICWPFFAEQQVNCRYACTTWGVGLEIDSNVKSEQVEGLVREMMEGEEGKKMREMALEWKKKSEIAGAKGGSSFKDFHRFVQDLLQLADNGKIDR
ncbi:flavonol 3-O-glucosyltransferase [Tripterygium wilfordii]|uniref:Glycosyltransferase n=1 Tax=Tripterygium wilfordii TaxID=458696 RepID=A0A7J7DK12_TRIWF|nr:7-deoxyloganetin glucosyltransferase-like [Tripterygium wilfordii]KAF5746671.1 flavonol 3-O-glucosyltransferase [Tripterygium wilfordii]